MKICIPKEIYSGECRVATSPSNVRKLIKLGFEVFIESGAGEASHYMDEVFREAGAEIVEDTAALWGMADILLKVRAPQKHPVLDTDETELLNEGSILVSFIYPAQNQPLLERLAQKKVTVLGVDAIPRTSRAQSMDALSSMANIAGYRAMVEASTHFGRFFTGQITAAGRIPPAKVLVIGAGVAGLSAIGSAQSMGAIVRAFDTRPAVKEQVQSMGAEFLELEFEEDGTGEGGYAKTMSKEFIEAEMTLFAEQAKDVDIIVTTALIPGKKSPILITEDMVKSMRQGSVIVDLAAEQGGNCEVTQPGEVAVVHGVTIIGRTDLPSRLPTQASQLYGSNLFELIKLMGDKEHFNVNMDDEIIRGATILHNGELTWPPPPPKTQPIPQPQPKPEIQPSQDIAAPAEKKTNPWPKIIVAVVGLLLLGGLGSVASDGFLSHLTVFVLGCFVGWLVVWNVTPSLHTPLMSVTNAISGIILIGGMLHISDANPWIGAIAILLATINVMGGFLVTQRMLKMFRK